LASLLVNNKTLNINITNCCAISNNKYLFNNHKFNLILTNPPFGTNMNYKELEGKFNENKKDSTVNFKDVYPIEINNGACLFLQHIIYMLEENGIAGIVFPDGQELVNKNNYNIRKYLVDNCKILKIIEVQGGVFPNTGVKTKIIIFKKQKSNDNYKAVEFYEIKKHYTHIKLIAIANLDNKIIATLKELNKINLECSLNKNEIEFIQFGELFSLIEGSIQSSKVVEDKDGEGVLINLSKIRDFKRISNYQLTDENIFISNVSPLGLIQYYKGKCSYTNLLYHIKPNENYKNKINIKFIYYYLKDKQEFIEDTYQKGTANKSLNVEDFNNLKIPIPTIEIQNEIINYCENNENTINNLMKTIEENKKMMKTIIETI